MFTAPLPRRLMDDEGPVWTNSFVDPWTVPTLKLSFGNLSASLHTRLFTEFINQILCSQNLGCKTVVVVHEPHLLYS